MNSYVSLLAFSLKFYVYSLIFIIYACNARRQLLKITRKQKVMGPYNCTFSERKLTTIIQRKNYNINKDITCKRKPPDIWHAMLSYVHVDINSYHGKKR